MKAVQYLALSTLLTVGGIAEASQPTLLKGIYEGEVKFRGKKYPAEFIIDVEDYGSKIYSCHLTVKTSSISKMIIQDKNIPNIGAKGCDFNYDYVRLRSTNRGFPDYDPRKLNPKYNKIFKDLLKQGMNFAKKIMNENRKEADKTLEEFLKR